MEAKLTDSEASLRPASTPYPFQCVRQLAQAQSSTASVSISHLGPYGDLVCARSHPAHYVQTCMESCRWCRVRVCLELLLSPPPSDPLLLLLEMADITKRTCSRNNEALIVDRLFVHVFVFLFSCSCTFSTVHCEITMLFVQKIYIYGYACARLYYFVIVHAFMCVIVRLEDESRSVVVCHQFLVRVCPLLACVCVCVSVRERAFEHLRSEERGFR